MYKINEIFYSLQGEGCQVGRPAVFVRFSGCNLRCSFCDTDFAAYHSMSLADVMESIAEYPSRFVVLTGGEPSLQVDTPLISALHERNYIISVETNGTHLLPAGIDWVTVSPKEGGTVVLSHANEVKVVYVGQSVEQYYRQISAQRYYLQPCATIKDGKYSDNRYDVIDYCLAHPHWSLSLQTHKLLNIR
ncbi:MAG: radical SAM protein [Prevotella sp.]|nr:radical SAM protein [Prevotella sp.]